MAEIRQYPQEALMLQTERLPHQPFKGVVVDIDKTIKDPGEPIPVEVFDTMHAVMQSSVFGIATGRSQNSLDRLVWKPFAQYLEERGLSIDENRLYVAGNNGSLATVGIENRTVLHSRPLDINQLFQLPANSTLRVLLEAYTQQTFEPQYAETVIPQMVAADNFDSHCFYFEAHLFPPALTQTNLSHLSIPELAWRINSELGRLSASQYQPHQEEHASHVIPLQAHANTEGIDITSRVSKATALAGYRRYTSDLLGQILDKNDILTIGDAPTGNDRELIVRPGGVTDITSQGATEVAKYINTMFNIVS